MQVPRVVNVINGHIPVTCTPTSHIYSGCQKRKNNQPIANVNGQTRMKANEINENSIEKAENELQLVRSVPVESSALSKGW